MRIGNRLAVNPMEGWDGETDGRPSENTIGAGAASARAARKLIWGGEAVAVAPGGARQSQPARDGAITRNPPSRACATR